MFTVAPFQLFILDIKRQNVLLCTTNGGRRTHMPRSDLTTRLRRDDVLKAIKTHPRITNDGLMRRLSLSYRQIQRATQSLRRAGRIRAHITEHLGPIQWRIKR